MKLRRALAAYFGLVSFVDDNVGKLIGALAATGLADDTRVLYSSDHGDNLGTRRLWGKSTMYEESAGVPMILAGPEVPEGFVCHEPVSLVDCFPTVVAVRRRAAASRRSRPARRIAVRPRARHRAAPDDPSRSITPPAPRPAPS